MFSDSESTFSRSGFSDLISNQEPPNTLSSCRAAPPQWGHFHASSIICSEWQPLRGALGWGQSTHWREPEPRALRMWWQCSLPPRNKMGSMVLCNQLYGIYGREEREAAFISNQATLWKARWTNLWESHTSTYCFMTAETYNICTQPVCRPPRNNVIFSLNVKFFFPVGLNNHVLTWDRINMLGAVPVYYLIHPLPVRYL